MSDRDILNELNRDYVRSVQTSNVQRFEEILADDFLCSLPDGSLVDRKTFLEQTARPITISNLVAQDVDIRLMGDVAVIHARTTYTAADGGAGAGRSTDVWAHRDGRWLVVVNDSFPTDWMHGWKFINFGPDGKLYASVGAPCNICDREADDPRYTSITRMNPDGSGLEVLADGWLGADNIGWGRPVDVLVMPDGALLVSDDRMGVIYRISYTEPSAPQDSSLNSDL